MLVCCYTDPETKLREQYNEQYKAARAGVSIDMELLAGGQNYFEKLQTQIAAGTMPDLYDMWEGYIQPYAENGALVNMDPYLEKDDKIKKADLVPAAVEAAAGVARVAQLHWPQEGWRRQRPTAIFPKKVR